MLIIHNDLSIGSVKKLDKHIDEICGLRSPWKLPNSSETEQTEAGETIDLDEDLSGVKTSSYIEYFQIVLRELRGKS